MRMTGLLMAAALAIGASNARAAPAGERHATTPDASAALRSPTFGAKLRLTVWYPAIAGVATTPVRVGPPGGAYFEEGRSALDAPWAAGSHPLLILSHGFGGSAGSMSWLGTALAERGYVVVAMDHPGQNARDGVSVPGVVLPWLRTDDVKAALDWALADPAVASHVDRTRIGFAGFSQGGFTGLSILGARSDTDHFLKFCADHGADPICGAPKEAPDATPANMIAKAQGDPAIVAMSAHTREDHSDPRVRSAFVMAPAPIQILDPESLRPISRPVLMMVGDIDPVAVPATNGLVAASLIPGVSLRVEKGVGHYDFLDACTPAGRKDLPEFCGVDPASQARTHARAITAADAFFTRTLRVAR